jgi:predicted porin
MLKRMALVALFLMFGLTAPVVAADLNGGGIADLEERIAELEVTAARKGNRKVSLTVYGQINKGIMFHDLDVPSSITKHVIGDGSQSPTAFGFMGDAKIDPEVKAGFRLEFGVNENAIASSGDPNQIVVRHSNIWVESMKVGRLTLGRGSVATDGIAEISAANTDVAAKMLNLEPFSTAFLFGAVNLPFDGGRRDVVRYDTPAIGGFIVSASIGKGDHFGPFNLSGDESTVYDVALRYAGEFGGFRVLAGAGYRNEDYSVAGPLLGAPSGKTYSGSASVKHMTSGLFVSGAYGKTLDFAMASSGADLVGMHAQGGWEHNVTGLGNTTLFAEWAQLKVQGQSGQIDMLGASAVQAIDAGALDLYGSWRQYDLGDLGVDQKVNTFMLGARLKF